MTKYISSHHTTMNFDGLVGLYREMLQKGMIEKNGAAHNRFKKLEDKQSNIAKWKNLPKSIRQNLITRSEK